MDDPQKSLRARFIELQDISRMAIQRILRKELKLYPYLITRRHGLLARDYPLRVQFADWFWGSTTTTMTSSTTSGGLMNRTYISMVTSSPTTQSIGEISALLLKYPSQNVTVTGIRYHEMLRLQFIPDLFNFCLQPHI